MELEDRQRSKDMVALTNVGRILSPIDLSHQSKDSYLHLLAQIDKLGSQVDLVSLNFYQWHWSRPKNPSPPNPLTKSQKRIQVKKGKAQSSSQPPQPETKNLQRDQKNKEEDQKEDRVGIGGWSVPRLRPEHATASPCELMEHIVAGPNAAHYQCNKLN